jgi:hypothetical protein
LIEKKSDWEIYFKEQRNAQHSNNKLKYQSHGGLHFDRELCFRCSASESYSNKKQLLAGIPVDSLEIEDIAYLGRIKQ